MRRVDNSRYKQRAWIVRGGEQYAFKCRIENYKPRTNEIGQLMVNTRKVIFAPMNIEIENHDKIRLARDSEYTVTVDDLSTVEIEDNESARRGNPLYEYRMDVS